MEKQYSFGISFLESGVMKYNAKEMERIAARTFLKPGGQIVLSPDVTRKISENKLLNWLGNLPRTLWQKYWQRVDKPSDIIEEQATKEGIDTGWTIGKLGHGRYVDKKNDVKFDERSYTIDISGVDIPFIEKVALEIMKAFKQDSVLIKDNSSGSVYLFDASEGEDDYSGIEDVEVPTFDTTKPAEEVAPDVNVTEEQLAEGLKLT